MTLLEGGLDQAPSPDPQSDDTQSDQAAVLAILQHAVEVSRDAEAESPRRGEIHKLPAAVWREVPLGTIREYMDALLVGKNPEPALDVVQMSGMLAAWMPEVDSMVGFGDGEWRHKDVWKHTKQVVRQSVPRIEVRWGSLLHDIGKPRTRSMDSRGEVHFHGHAEVGAAMFRKRMSKRLGFDEALHERIHFLILYHLRASHYDGTWTDAAVRRFSKEMGDGLKDLLDLSRADITTKRPHKRKRGLRQISELAARIRKIETEDSKPQALPKGLGTAIMERFDMPGSKRLGDLMKELKARAEQGTLPMGAHPETYLAYLQENREEFGL